MSTCLLRTAPVADLQMKMLLRHLQGTVWVKTQSKLWISRKSEFVLHPPLSLCGTLLCWHLNFTAPHFWHFYWQIRLNPSPLNQHKVSGSKWWGLSHSVLSVCHIVSQSVSWIKCLWNVFKSTADEKLYKCAIMPECVSVCVHVCVSVSNVAGRLKSTDTESLLPALSYLCCCLSMSPAHCTDRGGTHSSHF